MAVLLKAYRNIIIEHRWPDMPALGGVLALGCLLLFVGYRVFDRTRARFAEEI
jgi:ABC-type polysaccharide/polyol phosphate export permease